MGSFITTIIMGIFHAIGTALAGAFVAELSLVQSFAASDKLPFGGSYQSLLGFNAIIIPGIAMLVFLVWLVAKGLTGGNSKTSTEDMLKRVIGALVVSFALSLIINPIQDLIGALDSTLMSVAGVGSHGLATTFGMIATTSAIGGIEDSIFVSIIILVLGMILAGILILILILAHAVVYILIYFAPYLTLFRKDGFREAVEGVTAALAMPFIITSILAIGIATMGATGGGLGVQPISGTITGTIGGQTITQAISLTSATTGVNAVTYLSNALGGILILGAAVVLPKFILSMAFQAGNAIHDAFRSGHQQLASTATNAAKPASGGKLHQLAQFAHSKIGGAKADTPAPGGDPASESRTHLQDVAASNSGKGPANGISSPPTSSPRITNPESAPRTPSGSESVVSGIDQPNSKATDSPSVNSPSSTLPPSVDDNPATGASDVETVVGAGALANAEAQGAASAARDTEATAGDRKHLRQRAAHAVIDHYKGVAKAVPNMVGGGVPNINPESPLPTGINMRSAWRSAKRESIHQVKSQRKLREQQQTPRAPTDDQAPPTQGPEPRQAPPTQGPEPRQAPPTQGPEPRQAPPTQGPVERNAEDQS